MNKFVMVLFLMLVGCSTMDVSFNKNINPEPSEFNRYGMQWEKGIK